MENLSKDERTGSAGRSPRPGITVHLSTGSLWAVGLLAVLVLVASLALLQLPEASDSEQRTNSTAPPRTSLAAPAPAEVAGRTKGNPGPWGDLEYVKIALERPDEFTYWNYASNHATRWFFGSYDPEHLTKLLSSLDAKPQHRAQLLDASSWQISTNGIWLTPPAELILDLAPEARRSLYSILADWPENSFQHSPYLFQASEVHEWFNESGLSPGTLALIQKLLYPRGDAVCFSDVPELLSMIPTAGEKKRFMKTLSRQFSILMKLHVNAQTDVDRLAGYWGKAGRAKDVRPLLESLARVPGGASIDVAHLLPPFARMRLYTFPYPSDDPVVSRRNCFWTALNFFSDQPDDRFCDAAYAQKVIQEEYYPIQDEPAFGDVVFLLDSRESVIHAAVYLADDKVFTKNGRHFSQPWRVMDVADMLAEYPSNDRVRSVVYRLKRL